ncbi:MAG: glutaredoxin family protein [Pseudomonadota bacterium]
MRTICLLVCALALALPAGAGVTKWIDAQGRVHYGDRPPVGKGGTTAPLRGTVSVGDGITLVPGMDTTQGADAEFARAVAAPRKGEVWIYTTANCGFCKRAMRHLGDRGIAFVEKDIGVNAAYQAEFRAIGGRGVPVTLSGSQRANGYRKEAFEAFLKAAGF